MSWKKKEYKLALEREQKHSGWLRNELRKAQKELAEAKEQIEALKEPARAALTTSIQRNLYGAHDLVDLGPFTLGPPPDPAPGRYVAETDAREYTPIRPEDLGFFDPKEPWVPPKDLERVHSRAEFVPVMKEELERAKEGLRFTRVGMLFDPEPGPLLLDPDPDKK